jgi:hypothetical protein
VAHPLIHLAERWGIGDDYDREQAVDEATDDELRTLVSAVNEVGDDFWKWLAGPDSHEKPSDEYVAMTALTEAADSARLVLRDRSVGGHS